MVVEESLIEDPSTSSVPVVFMGALDLWGNTGASIHMREVVLGVVRNGIVPWVVCLKSKRERKQVRGIHEVAIAVMRKRFFLQLSLNACGTLGALKAVWKSGARVIYTRLDPGVFSGLLVAFLTRSKLVVELNGLPTVDLQLYSRTNKALVYFSKHWERIHYKYADVIIGSPGYAEYLTRHFHVPKDKLHVVPLGVDTELFKPIDRRKAQGELHLADQPTIVWVGTVAGWQGLECLLEVAVKLQRNFPGCRLRIVGDGPDLGKLRAISVRLKLAQVVTFVGSVPYERVPLEIAVATVCVSTFPGNRGDKSSIASLKTLNYLSCGRPVITTDMDEMATVIEERGAGISVEPDDVHEMERAISTVLLESPDSWDLRCCRAKEITDDDRTWAAAASRIAAKLKAL
jgi:glycosyltransferase involved in cell wall biosynthesis